MTESLVYAVATEHKERTGHDPFSEGVRLSCNTCIMLINAKEEAQELERRIQIAMPETRDIMD